jgi:signal transduction histidine kinase
VIENLVDNAFKYGRDGGLVHVALTSEGTDAVLRVRDDGPGIPQDDQPRVFERFYRGGGELTRTVAGTGLGLAIVRRNVEFHGGEVVLKSEEGRGTTFEIRIPLVEEPNA